MSTPSQTGATPLNVLTPAGATSPPPVTASGQPIAPGTGGTVSDQDAFNEAWWKWRHPAFDPFFYGFAWGPKPDNPILSLTGRKALGQQIEAANIGQNPVEGIEWLLGYGEGDPATANTIAAMQGTSNWPPANFDAQVVDINQPGAVVPVGGYSGPLPAGWTAVVTVNAWLANKALLPIHPLRLAPPAPPVNPVGPQEFENSPYYSLAVPTQVAVAQYPTWPGPTPNLQYTLESEKVATMFGIVTEYFYILGPVAA